MSTINQHISTVRNLIEQFNQDNNYTDEYLYHLFNSAAATLIQRKAEKFHKLSDWNVKDYCIKLEKQKAHDCSCAPGCMTLRTKYKIPRPLMARNRPLLKAYTLDYDEIPLVTTADIRSYKYDTVKSSSLMGILHNQYIYVYGGTTDPVSPKAIIVSSYPKDVTEWTSIQFCNADGIETTPCFNIDSDDYPLDDDMALLAYEMVLTMLNISFKMPKDDTNNLNPEK